MHILLGASLFAVSLLGPAAPSRAQIAPIDAGTVNAVCLDSTDDMSIAAYAYDEAGYLMCVATDADSEGVAIYQESSPGSRQFNLLSGGGGIYFSRDLQSLGVPSASADALVSSILQQLGS
jgi:hypothetical protein